ncbi:MAG TPA: terminase [Burkholderiaceae bacterium]
MKNSSAPATDSPPPASSEDLTIEQLARFYANPLAFVLWAFPWGEPGRLEDEDGPDVWQADILRTIGERLRAGAEAQEAIRIAVASGHGIGKTALIAWLLLWFIATREHPQIVATANTRTQLLTKTWRELGKWHKLFIVGDWFEWTATKYYLKAAGSTWFASAVPWSEASTEAFAGTHEKYVLIVFDEASAIADPIWETTEGAMTSSRALWVAFGNPTRTTGRFRECFGRFKHRWITRQIDSRSAKKANSKEIAQWVADYGEDSDFVRVRVRGVFPRASSTQFIDQDTVDACRRYLPPPHSEMPKIVALDVARFGDDQSAAVMRQGRVWSVLQKWRQLSLVNLANRFIEVLEEEEPDAIVIDGDGIGAGVVDILVARGYHKKDGKIILTEFHGSAAPLDPKKYFNRRAEVWGRMDEAMKAGVWIPDDPELESELTGPEYFFTSRSGYDVMQLESKEDMKKRGLSSPDIADGFAYTFAVQLKQQRRRQIERERVLIGTADSAESPTGWMGS